MIDLMPLGREDLKMLMKLDRYILKHLKSWEYASSRNPGRPEMTTIP
jgi:hypothetical protein